VVAASARLVSPTRRGGYPLVATSCGLRRLKDGERLFGGIRPMLGAAQPMRGTAGSGRPAGGPSSAVCALPPTPSSDAGAAYPCLPCGAVAPAAAAKPEVAPGP